VLLADARQSETLQKAGVEKADAIIPATENELANLDIALEARELNPGIKVVLRMFDEDLARRVEKGFGIRTAISTSALAAPVFAAAAMRLNIEHSFYVDGVLMMVSELTIEQGARCAGWTLAQLQQEVEHSVVYYHSQTMHDLHPPPTQTLATSDRIMVVATLPALEQLAGLTRIKG
jgi:Trk K+ transport system NAD-binding subunit